MVQGNRRGRPVKRLLHGIKNDVEALQLQNQVEQKKKKKKKKKKKNQSRETWKIIQMMASFN